MVGTPRPHHSLYRTCCPLPRVKPAGSVNDMALDAFDLDRMKQVSAYFPEGPGGARGRGGGWQHLSPACATQEQSIASAPRGNPACIWGSPGYAEVWEAAGVARVPWLRARVRAVALQGGQEAPAASGSPPEEASFPVPAAHPSVSGSGPHRKSLRR